MRDRCTKNQGIPLPALIAQLRESCEASTRLHGGTTYHTEELGIFRAIASELGLYLSQAPTALSSTPTAEANEHQVWYQEHSASFLKATWPDHFGMKVVHRHDEDPRDSPIGYLIRWQLHNELFGDSVTFLGALDSEQGLRLLIEQPAIEGTIATEDQIRLFFETSGWHPFRVDGNLAYYEPSREVVISDTHQGNIIVMTNGILAPIDLRVQPLTPTLISIVKNLCHL